MFEGFHCLLVTPMKANGEIDEPGLRRLVNFQIENGVHGILALGSTGECFTMTDAERVRVMEVVADQVAGRVPVSFGAAATSADLVVEMCHHAEAVGAASVMVPPPYYTPLMYNTVEGIYQHYATIAAKTEVPIMIYDGGSGIEVPMDVLRRLAKTTDHIKYLKVTVPSVAKVEAVSRELGHVMSPFCGNDGLTMLELAAGAKGMTIGIGNVLPKETADLYNLYAKGEVEGARGLFYTKICPLMSVALASTAEFIQCFKQALVWMGIIESAHVRQPLQPMSAARMAELRSVLRIIGVPIH